MRPFKATLLAVAPLLAILSSVVAETTCSADKHCPKHAPCCSEYGFCGIGSYCLGGCNPLHSHSLTSCTPSPICKNTKLEFKDDSRILADHKLYEGNATTHDLVVEKGNIFITPEHELVLTLTKANNGTKLSTTRFVHYGVITARMKTARTAGVVSAFITMSNVKDEIDWEFPGAATSEAQSNYFWLGVVDYSNNKGETVKGLADTYSTYHDFTIDWQPDELKFSIDGEVKRTVKRLDTLSKDGTHYAYPTTPSRVQLSIWPAGIPGTPQGTVDWAGGMIDWNDKDYIAQGQFAVLVKSLEIACTPETSATSPNGTIPADARSYVYMGNDTTGLVPQVYISNVTTNVNGANSVMDSNRIAKLSLAGLFLAFGGFALI